MLLHLQQSRLQLASGGAFPQAPRMKREAPEDDEDAEHAEQNGSAKRARSEPADDDDDDLDAPVGGAGLRGGGVKKGHECPYLDTISRQVRPWRHHALSFPDSHALKLQCACVSRQGLHTSVMGIQ